MPVSRPAGLTRPSDRTAVQVSIRPPAMRSPKQLDQLQPHPLLFPVDEGKTIQPSYSSKISRFPSFSFRFSPSSLTEISRISTLRIFPVTVVGNASTNFQYFGILYVAICPLQNSVSSAPVAVYPLQSIVKAKTVPKVRFQ